MRKTTEFSWVKPENVRVFCGNQVRKVNSGGKACCHGPQWSHYVNLWRPLM